MIKIPIKLRMDALNPKDIESISVLKGQNRLRLYVKKGKYGD